MSRALPERPSLEFLKKESKTLLRAAQQGDHAALRRFAALPAFAKLQRARLATQTFAIHDAQSVVAREHGFASWNALREEVESRTLSFDQAVDEFVRCATGGAPGRASRLLELYPRIATASLQTCLVLGDADGVMARLRATPQLLGQAGGPQQWVPLLYACHTCMHRESPARTEGLVSIARQLLALGADPNAEYHWNWHPELPRTALWASVCEVAHLPLAEVLLQAGANPTDGVTAHITAGGGNVPALELLHRYGLNVNGIAGGVPPLVYILSWADTPVGVRWLLEHGADPNLIWAESADAPLHLAARRWDVPVVQLLVQHGAELDLRNTEGRTPYAVAVLAGNEAIARWLLDRGANGELSPLEQFVGCCSHGDREGAAAVLSSHPGLPTQLQREHHLLLQRQAESGNAAVLEIMLAFGFDPNVGDKDQVTALHRAAMAGQVDATRVLLAGGSNVNAVDGMFAATPLVWAVEGRAHPTPGSDYVGVARALIAAGSLREWRAPEGAPGPERTQEGLMELLRAAADT